MSLGRNCLAGLVPLLAAQLLQSQTFSAAEQEVWNRELQYRDFTVSGKMLASDRSFAVGQGSHSEGVRKPGRQ